MTRFTRTTDCASIIARGASSPYVASITEIAPAVSYVRSPPLSLRVDHATERARSQVELYFSQNLCAGRPIEVFDFPGAFLFGQGTVGLPDGTLVSDSAIEFLAHNLAPTGSVQHGNEFDVSNSGAIPTITGRALLAKRPWYANFGHWLVDLAPVILLAAESGIPFESVILGKVHSPQLAQIMIDLVRQQAPHAEIVIHDDASPVFVENLLYTRPVHVPPIYKHPCSTRATRNYGLARKSPIKTGRRLYIDRQHMASRGIVNHQDVTTFLESFGFEAFKPETASFSEQISAFNQAEIVLGVKGAGLTNALFANPGSLTIVLTPSDFPDPFFWDLVSPLGVRYAEVFCKVVEETVRSPSHCEFVVDIDLLRSVFRDVGL